MLDMCYILFMDRTSDTLCRVHKGVRGGAIRPPLRGVRGGKSTPFPGGSYEGRAPLSRELQGGCEPSTQGFGGSAPKKKNYRFSCLFFGAFQHMVFRRWFCISS
jgi:hypothetical protein